MLCRVGKITRNGKTYDRHNLIGTDADVFIGKYQTRVDTIGGSIKLNHISVYESSKKVRVVTKSLVYTFYKEGTGGDYYEPSQPSRESL